jgi:hypothetical protein
MFPARAAVEDEFAFGEKENTMTDCCKLITLPKYFDGRRLHLCDIL